MGDPCQPRSVFRIQFSVPIESETCQSWTLITFLPVVLLAAIRNCTRRICVTTQRAVDQFSYRPIIKTLRGNKKTEIERSDQGLNKDDGVGILGKLSTRDCPIKHRLQTFKPPFPKFLPGSQPILVMRFDQREHRLSLRAREKGR